MVSKYDENPPLGDGFPSQRASHEESVSMSQSRQAIGLYDRWKEFADDNNTDRSPPPHLFQPQFIQWR